MEVITDLTATVIKSYDEYPDGANFPTSVTEYKCVCKKGKVVYKRIAGFDDDFAIIKCASCRKKYEVDYGKGYLWALIEK